MASRLQCEVYLQELADHITKFKGISIRAMIIFLNRKYPAEPEEVESLETELREPWDANNHIENLFQAIKEGCETLIRLNAIVIPLRWGFSATSLR
jgi:hypothetical protein